MKYIDIFLASSITELHTERMELGNYIRTLNDRFLERGVYFRLHMCEDISDEIALTRKQDEYNDVIRSCEYFFVLFRSRAGAFTIEEFDIALEKFKESGAPKIRTYFIKTEGETPSDVAAFMRRLETELQHYYNVIDSIDTIKLKLLLEMAADPELKATLEFKDSEVLLDGEAVKSIDLDKLPIYANHESISKMKGEKEKLEQEFIQARLDVAQNPADDKALQTLLTVNERKNKVLEELHELEKELMNAATRIVAVSNSGEYLTARAQKAIELFEQGRFDEAMAILDDEERKRETEAALKKLEDDKNELRGIVKEITLKIDTIKAKGINEKSANDIIELYEEAWNVISKGGLEYDSMNEYIVFLNGQKRYAKAIEKGEKLYHILKSMDDVTVPFISLCEYMAGAYGETRNFDRAEELYKEGLDAMMKLDAETRKMSADLEAMFCNDLAKLYMESNRFGPAESLFSKAYSMYKELAKTNPAYDERVALVCNNLGELCRQKKDLKAAENLFKTALNISLRLYKKNPGQFAPWIALISDNVGVIMMEQGKLKDAKMHISTAVGVARVLVENNPFVHELELIRSCNNMAVLLMRQGKYDEALKYYKESLDTSIRLASVDPDVYEQYVAVGYSNMAVIYMETRGDKAALPLEEKALEMYKKLAAKNPDVYNPYVAMVCGNMARCYSGEDDQRSFELTLEALKIYREMEKKNPGVHQQNICLMCNNIGSTCNDMERYDEAEMYFKEALSYGKKLMKKGVAMDSVALVYTNLGDTLYYTGRDDEAEKMYKEALNIYSIISETNPNEYITNIISVYIDLGDLYEYNGDIDSAEEAFKNAVDMFDGNLDAPVMQLITACSAITSLGALYWVNERMPEALPLYERAAELFEKQDEAALPMYGEGYAQTCMNTAELCVMLEDLQKAEEYYAKAVRMFTKLTKMGVGNFEPDLCVMYFELGEVYEAQGNTEQQQKSWGFALQIAEKYKDEDEKCAEIYEKLKQ